MIGQSGQPFGQAGIGQFGAQQELGNVVGAVVQATLPVILGSLRGQQPGIMGGQLGAPAFHAPGQFGQYGAQPDLSHLIGPVLQATLPVILSSLRGQPQMWGGGQAFGQMGVPAFYGQQSPFGYGGQADIGNILGPVLQATVPAILGSLRGQQMGGQAFGQLGVPAFHAQPGQFGSQADLANVLGPVLQAMVPTILAATQPQFGQAATGWRQ
jgi:hypothetical protein